MKSSVGLDLRKEIERLAALNGCRVSFKGGQRVEIYGHLNVVYFPHSPSKTAYVEGTRVSKSGVDPVGAIRMAIYKPGRTKPKRKVIGRRNVNRRRAIFKKDPRCHWCKKILMFEDSTTDHIIPLARGGVDNFTNIVIACLPCNQKRGSDMPEIKEGRIA